MIFQKRGKIRVMDGDGERERDSNLSGGHQGFVVTVFPSWTHCVATTAWNSRCRPAYELAALFSLRKCWARSVWLVLLHGAGRADPQLQLCASLLYSFPLLTVSHYPAPHPHPSSLSYFMSYFFDPLGIETDVHLPTLFSSPQMCLRKTKLSVSTERKGPGLTGSFSFVGRIPGGCQDLPGPFHSSFTLPLEVGSWPIGPSSFKSRWA